MIIVTTIVTPPSLLGFVICVSPSESECNVVWMVSGIDSVDNDRLSNNHSSLTMAHGNGYIWG